MNLFAGVEAEAALIENDLAPFLENLGEFERESVRIDPLQLNREYCRLPGQLAYWNAQLAEATEKAMEAKASFDRQRAITLLQKREEVVFAQLKRTVAEVDAMVTEDDDVVVAHACHVDAEARRMRVKGVVDAVHCKRDMLQSLGAKLRVEMEADPLLREQLAGRSAIDFKNVGG